MTERVLPRAVPLTGEQYRIQAGDYQAAITELGAGLRSLSFRGQPLITEYDPDQLPPAGAGQLLAPWPNRIDRGRYTFDGTTYQLALSDTAKSNAIHGLTRWANWRRLARGPAEIDLGYLLHGQSGYPFCLELSVGYRLDATSGLEVAVTARNVGSRPAPYGTGSHPYLTTGAPVVDPCELTLPATHLLPADERGIPSGAPADIDGSAFDFRSPRRVGETSIDHALTGLTRDDAGRAWATLASDGVRIGLWAGPGYDWLQVFTGDALAPELRRRALAVEPMTCPPNAFVTGNDLIRLSPGQQVTHRWGIQLIDP